VTSAKKKFVVTKYGPHPSVIMAFWSL